eukprot:2617600-Pleurochrysis_carterae.AAC.1
MAKLCIAMPLPVTLRTGQTAAHAYAAFKSQSTEWRRLGAVGNGHSSRGSRSMASLSVTPTPASSPCSAMSMEYPSAWCLVVTSMTSSHSTRTM